MSDIDIHHHFKFQMGPKRSLGGWWEGWSPIFKSQINSNYRISKPYRLEFGNFLRRYWMGDIFPQFGS
jgi:hypothetical protein